MKNLNLAVIGKDVSGSSSPVMHGFISSRLGYKVNYKNISIPEDEFDTRIERFFSDFDGFNVTIPYKLSVLPYLVKTVGDASVFGAVNTVRCSDRSGFNTDGAGFALMLKNGGINVHGKKILILGAGGAGRSVAKTLSDSGAEVYITDKRIQNSDAVASEFGGIRAIKEVSPAPYYAIINATGVGMHATEGVSPVSADILQNCELALDLIYTPAKSRFLQIAEALGKQIMNGLAMLFYQAYYAECIFAEIKSDELTAKALFEEFSEEKL